MSVVVSRTTKARVKLSPVTVTLADLSYLSDPKNWEKAPKKKRVVKKSKKKRSRSPKRKRVKSPKSKKSDKKTDKSSFKKAFTARLEKAKSKGQVIDVSDLKSDGTGAVSKVISVNTTKFVKVPGFTGVVSSSKRGVNNLEKLTGRKELAQKWADKKKGVKRVKSPKRKSPKRRSKSPKRKSPKRRSKSPKRKSPKRRSYRGKSPKSPRLPSSPGVISMSAATSPAGMPSLPLAPASTAEAVMVPSVPSGLPTIQAGSPLL